MENKKQSPWNKGKRNVYSKGALEKMRFAKIGKSLSEEHKNKISKANKGRLFYIMTDEIRNKISLSLKGKKQHYKHKTPVKKGSHRSLEVREKISKAHIGIKQSPESREKNRLGHIGIQHSKETRLKMSEAHKGSKSSFWRGGIAPETNRRVSSFEWKELRKQIYERDNWTCQICRKHCHNDIQCHHIVPYRISKDNNIENLQTLCRKCHMIADWNFINSFKVVSIEGKLNGYLK